MAAKVDMLQVLPMGGLCCVFLVDDEYFSSAGAAHMVVELFVIGFDNVMCFP